MTAAADLALLVETHQGEVWRYLRFLGCDAVLAEDLTQETFLALLTRPFVSISRPATSAYLRTVARNLVLKQARRVRGAVDPRDVNRADLLWSKYHQEDGGSAYLDAFRGCLESLDDRSREALHLRYQEHLSQEAAAASLRLSFEGLKTLVRRAKERIKQCVDGKLQHE